MKHITKTIIHSLTIISVVTLLTGCTKCIYVTTFKDTVQIINARQKKSHTQLIPIDSTYMPLTTPESNEIVVKYKNETSTINDKETYDKYHDKIGKTATATIKRQEYDDGSIFYTIISLE